MVIRLKFLKKHGLFITVLLLCITVVFSKFLFTSMDYVIGYDTKNIYVPFYEEIRTLFSQGEPPFWNHNFFLGGNILASKGYYFLGDFFAYFSVLLPKLRIEDILLIIQVLKFILCTLLMYLTLQEMKIRTCIAWFVSLLFTFSSWMLIFMGTPAFASFAAILPLLMLGLERYLNRKKFGLVALATFLLVLDNFYLFWSASFYLVLYWPCRYFLKHSFCRESVISFFKSTLFLILIYSLGVFAAGFMLIPTIGYMIHVPRVTESVDYTLLWPSKKIYLDMFIKFISAPFYVNTNIPNLFGTQYYRTDQIALFSSSIIALILPQIYVVFKKQTKWVLTLFLAINGIMLIFPFFGSMMHGFAEPSFRWTMMLVLSFVLIGAHLLNHYEKFDYRLMFSTILLYLFGVLIILFYKRADLAAYSSQLKMIGCSFILFFVYASLLCLSKQRKWLIFLVGTICAFETTSIAKLSLDTYAEEFQKGYHYDELGIPKDYFASLSDKDEFYRIYINEYHVDLDHHLEFNYNSNMFYNFKGLYGYDSTTQYSTQELLLWSEEYYWWYKINNPVLHDVLTTKYYVVQDPTELPDDQFELVEKIADSSFYLYRNLNYLPFGFSYTKTMPISQFYQYYSIDEKTEAYRQAILLKDEDIQNYQLQELNPNAETAYMRNVQYTNNHIQGNLSLNEKQLVFFSIPYDKGWTITANGIKQDILISEGGFMSILLDRGNYDIKLDFYPSGLNLGFIISCFSCMTLCLLHFLQRRRKHG